MVSYDVCSLFTNVPLHETIDIPVETIFENKHNINIEKQELKQLFLYGRSQTHFLFNVEVFDQIDGVAMGSPLGPALANLFMGYYEKQWLNSSEGCKTRFYRRYVDDIFCIFDIENDSNDFLEYLNKQHPNIKFTMEKENEKQLPFLDVLSNNTNNLRPTYLLTYNSKTNL